MIGLVFKVTRLRNVRAGGVPVGAETHRRYAEERLETGGDDLHLRLLRRRREPEGRRRRTRREHRELERGDPVRVLRQTREREARNRAP